MIRTSRAHLERAAKEYDGRARTSGYALDIAVSDAALDRALGVTDALLKALEGRGHSVELQEGKPAPASPSYNAMPQAKPETEWNTVAMVEDTAVVLSLEEAYETIEVPAPPPSGLRETHSWNLPRPVKERIPNGRLVLTVHNAPRSERLTCGDTKRQAIESRLRAFVLLLEATSSAIRAAEVEAARHAEERRRLREEHEKAEELRRRLRSYAVRVEHEVVRNLPDPEQGPEPIWGY